MENRRLAEKWQKTWSMPKPEKQKTWRMVEIMAEQEMTDETKVLLLGNPILRQRNRTLAA